MKFAFVIGGSYKSFYLNYLYKIGRPDIIVFNSEIFYDFDVEKESCFNGPISKELKYLNKVFKCPIVVHNTIINNGQKDKCFIVCNHGKINIFDKNCDIYIRTKNKWILIGSKQYYCSNVYATITIGNSGQWFRPNQRVMNNYFYVNKKNVMLFSNGKFYRKFNKCCKFILHFLKKVV